MTNTIEIHGVIILDGRETDFCAYVSTPWYDPGRTYGDPYDCYPPESGGGELVEIWEDTKEGAPIPQALLDQYPDELESALEAALERWKNNQADAEEAAREASWGI